jgi:hypothetical protein
MLIKMCNKLAQLTSWIGLAMLLLSVDPGYPRGAPLQVICRGTLGSMLVLVFMIGARCELTRAARNSGLDTVTSH